MSTSPVEVITTARTATDALARGRELVEPALRAAVGSLPESMRRIAGYHFGWWDEQGAPIRADSGKAIRPVLVLAAAEAVGGTAAQAVPAAVAVELVHNFTLLHDDVMDGDRTRRHRPTAWSAFGTGQAILAGDALLTLAFDVLARDNAPAATASARALSAAVLAVQDGQAADLLFEQRTDVTLPECVRMAEGKTAALLGCATELGARYGGATEDRVTALRLFGTRLGLAFQFADDLLGIWGDPVTTGKPVHSDLVNRKKSIPVVAALTSGTPAAADLTALYRRRTPLSASELAAAADLIDRSGARAWTQTRADTLLAEALSHLASAHPAPTPAADLTAIAHLATRRDH